MRSKAKAGKPRTGLAVLGVALVALSSLSACHRDGGEEQSTPAVSADPAAENAQQSRELEALIERASNRSQSEVGIAVDDGRYAGGLQIVPAWSTIKVPIAIAAMQNADLDDEYVRAHMESLVEDAITISDNDAAIELWDSLGELEEAKEAVEKLLVSAGDHTRVHTEVTEEGFRGFGETLWSLSDQALFADQIPRLPQAELVFQAMGEIDQEQAYGLGILPNTNFKGGWGPNDLDGTYLIRQFGIVPLSCGYKGVAIAATADDGSYETGQEALTELARGLDQAICSRP